MEEGIVKIGDYGLAKLITPSQGSEHSESIGTCHYMAPEIASGKYDKPIDIYAIGVILYEMLTGRVPFEGETVGEVLMKHLTARPDVSPLAEPYRSIVAQGAGQGPEPAPQRGLRPAPPDDAPEAPERPVHRRRQGRPDVPGAGDIRVVEQAEEEVLRIEAEEPVFYIGPDTPAAAPRRSPSGSRRALPASADRSPRRTLDASGRGPKPQPTARKAKREPEPPPSRSRCRRPAAAGGADLARWSRPPPWPRCWRCCPSCSWASTSSTIRRPMPISSG